MKTSKIFNESYNIIDLTDLLECENCYKPSVLDSEMALKRKAIKDMIKTIASVSLLKVNRTDQVRDIEINGLHIYWQTYISEKHPARSVLLNLFYLKHLLLNALTELKFTSVFIILPSLPTAIYCNSIKKFFLKDHSITDVNFNFKFDKTSFAGIRMYTSKLLACLKESLAFQNNIRSISYSTDTILYDNYIVTNYPNTWVEKPQEDRVLGALNNYFEHTKGIYIPYITNLSSDIRWRAKWSGNYLKALPGKFQIINHYVKSLIIYNKINKLRKISFKETDFIDGNVLVSEFQRVLFEQNFVFFNYLWMKKFFSSIQHKVKVFYQDEFYPTGGRFVTQAIKRSRNNKITAYGVQHGIIYDDHSVYDLIPEEVNETKPNNALPKPHKFIVWGEYFKNLLNKNNAFSNEELVVAGNLTYIDIAKNYSTKRQNNNELIILWCCTEDYVASKQYEIILPFLLSLPNFKLIIRCHPMFDLKDFILNFFDKTLLNNVTFSRDGTIFEAIFDANIIIANTISTIFMDALVLNRIVFQIKTTPNSMPLFHSTNAVLIGSSSELQQYYHTLGKQTEKNFIESQNLLYLKDDIWKSILTKPDTSFTT